MSHSTNYITQATFLNLSSDADIKNLVKCLIEIYVYSCTNCATFHFPSILNKSHFISLCLRVPVCRLSKLIKISE